jgi:transcriptional regulator with XRE-family HTH domain
MNLSDLGLRIRTRREKCGLTQQCVASALQVSPQAVSKWERGENAPDISQFVPLGKLLGVSVDWLLGSFSENRDVFEATVLASGVQSARGLSETMTPREFAAWTNTVCFQVTEAILRHDGVPVKTTGPGVLSFFSGAEHSQRAVQAALSAVATAEVPLKIGVCHGEVYVGAIGHPDYAQPDIMGEAVSIALLAMDWAATNTASGVAACAATLAATTCENAAGPACDVTFAGISHGVQVREIRR